MKTKTKKGNVTVIALIIVIVAITAGVVGWMVAKNSQTPAIGQQPVAPVTSSVQAPQQAVAPVQAPQTMPTVKTEPEAVIYKNAALGFQITFPNGWEKYKALVSTDKTSSTVSINLPTIDKTWPTVTDPTTGKALIGYASMFSIVAWNINDYNNKLSSGSCDYPGCPSKELTIAKGSKYAYELIKSQSLPKDLPSGYMEEIQNNFQILAQ